MTEVSRPWDGITNGDAVDAPYSSDEWAEIQSTLGAAAAVATYKGGVCRDELNEFLLTGSATPLSVDTGRALVNGYWYENDAAVNLAIATTGSVHVDRIVLRLTYAASTIRLAVLQGVNGAGVPLALTNNGTTWEIPLWKFSVSALGAMSGLVDERTFIPWHGDQSGEAGTKHTYSQIALAPAFGATPTNVNPEVASAVGATGTYAGGQHVHGVVAPPFGYKTGNTTRTNDTSLSGNEDPNLVVALAANHIYIVEALLLPFNADGTPGFKFDLTIPSGTVFSFAALGQDPVNAPPVDAGIFGSASVGLATPVIVNLIALATATPVLVHALVSIGVTGGNAHIRWAQNVASVSNGTVLQSGSYMRAIFVA